MARSTVTHKSRMSGFANEHYAPRVIHPIAYPYILRGKRMDN